MGSPSCLKLAWLALWVGATGLAQEQVDPAAAPLPKAAQKPAQNTPVKGPAAGERPESAKPGREKAAKAPSEKTAAKYPPRMEGAKVEVYKTIGEVKLPMYRFEPAGHTASAKAPAIVLFFGGGWNSGTPQQFEQQCRYLAARGVVALAADYRVASRHQAQVADCVRDAKSAVRWVRTHAARLGIDPQRVAAGGGSAGGHLAACTATVPGLDEATEDASISSRPNALVLFNPALALADYEGANAAEKKRAAALSAQRLGAEARALSPLHHVQSGQPPSIVFFGTEDALLASAQAFRDAARKAGNRCELVTFDGQAHGFFNFGRGDNSAFRDTLRRSDEFLAALGWLAGPPTVDRFDFPRSGR